MLAPRKMAGSRRGIFSYSFEHQNQRHIRHGVKQEFSVLELLKEYLNYLLYIILYLGCTVGFLSSFSTNVPIFMRFDQIGMNITVLR